jgi:hypothetical protein
LLRRAEPNKERLAVKCSLALPEIRHTLI